ncbi:Holin-like protein, partial [Dysosmobacter welbionis]
SRSPRRGGPGRGACRLPRPSPGPSSCTADPQTGRSRPPSPGTPAPIRQDCKTLLSWQGPASPAPRSPKGTASPCSGRPPPAGSSSAASSQYGPYQPSTISQSSASISAWEASQPICTPEVP